MTGRGAGHRVLIHAGFHKTGTSTAQQFLRHNAGVLAACLSLRLVEDMQNLSRLSMLYSTQGATDLPAAYAVAVDQMLTEGPALSGRDLLLSSESLSGRCPGWPGLTDYRAAPRMIARLVGILRAQLPDRRIEVVLTTRDARDWLWSAWRHHIRGQRLTEDWDAFRVRLGGIDLSAETARIADAIPSVRVHEVRLNEASLHPLGPGGALLDLLDLGAPLRAALRPVDAVNHGQDDALAAEMLALNRSGMGDDEVQARKAALARAAGVGRWGWRPG